jgi:hypothetical protein
MFSVVGGAIKACVKKSFYIKTTIKNKQIKKHNEKQTTLKSIGKIGHYRKGKSPAVPFFQSD